MNRVVVSIVVTAAGIVLFFTGLYGLAGAASWMLAVFALALMLCGTIASVISLRDAARSRPHVAVFVLAALGVALHLYEQVIEGSGSIGWLLWSLLPYAVCLMVARLRRMHLAAIAGTAAVLLLDAWVHYNVFVHPTSSTAALSLLYAPIMDTLVFAPIAMLGGWLLTRRRFGPAANDAGRKAPARVE